MRLIDADELKECLDWCEVCRLSIKEIKEDYIDTAPTVDTTCPNCDSGYAQGYSDGYLKGKEERPRGEWITDERGYVCSECGALHGDDYPFCHMCGAEMRGNNNE